MRIYEDLRVVQSRLAVLQALAVVLVAALVVQFWNLQVIRARHFRGLAENNRSRLVTLAAPRGALLDREGQVLVGNRPSFNVVLVPELADNLDRLVARLSATLDVGEATIRERLVRRQPYRPVVVKTDATLADVAALEARRLELPEVSVEVVPLRSYPLASAAAHALGRVGEITERQLQLAEYKDLAPGSLVGQAGIESEYNRDGDGQGRLPPRRREQPWPRGRGGGAPGAGGRAQPHPQRSTPRCRPRWRRPSRAGRARRWRSTRARARSWPWPRRPPTTRTSSRPGSTPRSGRAWPRTP